MKTIKFTWLMLGLTMSFFGQPASAFQIAPLGTHHETRLTNEKDSTIARVAGTLGILIKAPVHEEITHLGKGCLAERASLLTDNYCSGSDVGVASPYIIYGVRWNDLPPFKLDADAGNCSYPGQIKSCQTDQTVRFSTQPLCWYCLFKDAEKKSQTKKITGCERGKGTIRGNVMTRSHFGDLQFLHGMASEESVHPVVTRAKILDWVEFAWKVSSREIGPESFLRDVQIPTIKEHFGCTEWRVSDLYLLGRQDRASGLMPQIREIAFGSVLHTVQDSFAAAHASREATASGQTCEGTQFAQPPRVIEFHNYGAQDGKLHDDHDSREAMAARASVDRWPEAVDATRNLFDLHEDGAKWDKASTYVKCLFELSENKKPSSPGELFKRGSQVK